jgi:ribosomal protein S15P/S13E
MVSHLFLQKLNQKFIKTFATCKETDFSMPVDLQQLIEKIAR